ncbi:MAG TPA: hypothetical protein VHW24_26170 [Bryobacteraceae bacterium]|jgi:hypothetical protein|nr:hypothetical protein [Bryobacteraceae bacterium]
MDDRPARRFPAISEKLYTESSLGSIPLSAALPPILSFAQPDPPARFTRILTVHRRAFEAEAGCVWDRADFYWSELERLILAGGTADPCWIAGQKLLFPDEAPDGPAFRQAFLSEMVLDVHAGFFTGGVQSGYDPTYRPGFHLRALSRLFKTFAEFTAREEGALVDPLVMIAITYYKNRDLNAKVEPFWWQMTELFPRQLHYVEATAGAIHADLERPLQQAVEGSKPDIFANAIQRAQKLQAQFPTVLDCYRLLGALFHGESIALANANRLPEALLAAKKSEVYGGSNAALEDTQRQLNQVFTAMQEKVAQLLAQVARTPGATLNARGQQLANDARNGSRHADDFVTSSAAETIRKAREKASPAPPPASLNGVPPPVIHVTKTEKVAGEMDFGDWLRSKGSLRVRIQIAAAAVLLLFTGILFAREAWGVHARDGALQRAEAGIGAGNDAAALDALSDFFAAPTPLHARRAVERHAVTLYAETLTRWLAAKGGNLSVQDRRRVETYRRQIVDRGLDAQAEVTE